MVDNVPRGGKLPTKRRRRYVRGGPENGCRGWPKLTNERRAAFLEHLAEHGIVSRAAQEVDVSRSGLYQLRDTDPGFAADWGVAQRLGDLALVDEARRRGLAGYLEPVIWQGRPQYEEVIDNDTGEVVERVPVVVRKYSDTLLIAMLKARFREFADRLAIGGTVRTEPSADLSQLTDDELHTYRGLLAKAQKT